MDKLEFQGTAEGWKFTSDGEANFYGIKTGKNWLMRIQQNGELMPAKQMANMQLILASQKMIKALQYVAHTASRTRRKGNDRGPAGETPR